MPRQDGTGPMGQGSMTGRGLGTCVKRGLPVLAGIAAGIGFGRGFCRRRQANTELDSLKEQAGMLESQLQEVQKRIEEIEKK